MLVRHRIDRELFLHPFAACGGHRRTSIVLVHQGSDSLVKSIGVLGRNEQSCLAILHRLTHTAGLAGHDRNARRSRLECGDTKALCGGRMHEQVEAADEGVQVIPVARELHDVAETQPCRLRAQLAVQVPLAENKHAKRRMRQFQFADRLQQVSMAFPRDQLARGGDGKHAVINAEFLSKIPAIRLPCECSGIHRAANDDDSILVDALLPQDLCDRIGYRYDFEKRPVSQFRHDAHLGVVHAPRHDRRHISKTGCQPAQQIGATPTVAVDDIGFLLFEELRQPVGKRQIQVAGTEEVLHANPRLPGGRIYPGIRRANEDIVVTPLV